MNDKTPSPEHRREVTFTIDGQEYTIEARRLQARQLLELAGLDPALFDLGELRGHHKPKTTRYQDCDVVRVRPNARFVSIRQCADVA